MKTPPFHYGSPVLNKSFIDRKNELEKLRSNLETGVHTVVLAPPGWGKTSLVHNVMADFHAGDPLHITMEINLFPVTNAEEFLVRFARSVIMASSEKWNDWVKIVQEHFTKTVPNINLGQKPDTDFTLEFNRESLLQYSDEVLILPDKLAAEKDLRFIIMLDAFHRLEKMNGFQDLLKALLSRINQSSRVTYILIGNNTPWMTEHTTKLKGTQEDLLDVLQLGWIESKYWLKYIRKGFSKSGKSIDEATVKSMVKRFKGHPYYIQQLARFTWLNSDRKTGKKELNNGFKELMAVNQPLFYKIIETLSPTQVNLLQAIAKNEKHLTSARVMEQYRLGTPRNVAKNREMLLRKGVIQSAETYEFSDPLFEIWFRNEYTLKN
jgi:hypothetical protein